MAPAPTGPATILQHKAKRRRRLNQILSVGESSITTTTELPVNSTSPEAPADQLPDQDKRAARVVVPRLQIADAPTRTKMRARVPVASGLSVLVANANSLIMNYRVVPFVPSLDHKNPSGDQAAEQLNVIISSYSEKGWEYVRLESVQSWVAADTGCFGLGGKPGYYTSRQLIVFRKD